MNAQFTPQPIHPAIAEIILEKSESLPALASARREYSTAIRTLLTGQPVDVAGRILDVDEAAGNLTVTAILTGFQLATCWMRAPEELFYANVDA